jgi:uncharacterized tellurite resistance protein B-like protein
MDAAAEPSEPSTTSFELAALRLHLVVGMAAADEHIHDDEVTGLAEIVDSCDVTPVQRRYLDQLLLALVANPPRFEDLLLRLVDGFHGRDDALAAQLVDDLVTIAQVDGRVDPREEGMLRLVCGALEVEPVSLYEPHERAHADASASELADLVRSLLSLDLAA